MASFYQEAANINDLSSGGSIGSNSSETFPASLGSGGHSPTAERRVKFCDKTTVITSAPTLTVNSSTNSELPYINAHIENIPLRCLIDTGSSANILSSKCLPRLHPLRIDETMIRLCGINKSPLNVHGEAQINLKIGNKLCTIDVIIAEITTEVILGNPFIKEFGALVNLKDKILTIPEIPPVSVSINNVENISHNFKSIANSPAMITEIDTTYTVHCLTKSTILPFHAAPLRVSVNSAINCDSMLIYPEIPANVVGQYTSFDVENNAYTIFIINNTNTQLSFRKGERIGHAEVYSAENQLQLEVEMVEADQGRNDDQRLMVGSSYNLDLSDADRQLRWQELCRVLKVDEWMLAPDEKQKALEKLRKYEFLFALQNEPLGMMHNYEHEINVGDSKPINLRPRPLTEEKQKELDVILDDLLKRGIIRPSRSPWSAPLCMTRKSDNTWRLCIDYRKLNSCTIRDAFPLPNINHMLGTLKHSKFYSTVDLASGFHQLKIKECDIPLTAFCTPTNLYEFICLPFGLCNGPPSFVRAISSVLKFDKSKAVIYFDDILILGSTFQTHLENLLEVFQILVQANLKLKAKKCVMFALKIEFLGHVINEEGIACSPSKIESIKNIPIPKNPKSLRSYLGIFSYYRKFCPRFSEIAKPLFKLAVADKKDFKWEPEANTAFLNLKEMLCKPPILTLPTDNDTFILTTDASGFAIGAILTVDRPNGRKVIAYASHLLEKSRQAYGATKREMYSAVYYVQFFKMYLLPKKFLLETDHLCLKYLTNFKDPPAIIIRWIAILSDYNFEIIHKPATNGIIKVADALSRPTTDNSLMLTARSPDDNLLTVNPSIPCNKCDITKCYFDNEGAVQGNNDENVGDNNSDNNDENRGDDNSNNNDENKGDNNSDDHIDSNNGDIYGHCVNNTTDITNNNDEIEGTDGDSAEHDLVTQNKTRQQNVLQGFKTQLVEAQNSDKNIKRIKELLTNNINLSTSDIASDSPFVKFYWSQKSRLTLDDNILYFSPRKVVSSNLENHRIIVPQQKIKDILKLVHDDKTAGHRAPGKMLPIIKHKYHWFGMRPQIELYVKRCQSCQVHKKPRANRPRAPLFMTKVSSKFERISIDFAGPFNKTQQGNRFILLGVCCFTKFAFCIPMSSTDSQYVARMLIERWIIYFGVPLEIHSDAGSNLISELVKQLCLLLNIKQANSLPYVPQQNGAAERLVSTMKSMLCHFAVNKPRQWDNVVPLVVLAYNNQVHATTKVTPQQMVMGESARVSLDLAWGAPPIVEDIEEVDYVAWLRETLYDIHDYALEKMNKSIQITKDRFDKGQFGKPYVKDDLVWKLRGKFESGSRKFQRFYDGIYIVLEKVSNTSYLVKHLKNYREEIVHFNRLKRAYLNPLTLQSLLQQMKEGDYRPNKPHIDDIECEQPIIIGCRDLHRNQVQPGAELHNDQVGYPYVDLNQNENEANLPDENLPVDQEPAMQAAPAIPPRRRPPSLPVRVRQAQTRYNLRSRTRT